MTHTQHLSFHVLIKPNFFNQYLEVVNILNFSEHAYLRGGLCARVDGGSREGGRRRRRGRGRRTRVSERVGDGGGRDGHGCWRLGVVSVLLALGRRWTFAVKKSRCRGRLNSEKVEDGSAVSHSTRSQLQRRCVFFGSCRVVNEH